jgi:hypothetical protein
MEDLAVSNRNLARDAFTPEQVAIAAGAYERALDFVLRSGYDDGDPNVKENIAVHIIEAAKESPQMTLVALANRAIARYRVHRETMRAIALKRPTRRHGTQTSLRFANAMTRRSSFGRLEQNPAVGI